MAVDMLGAAGEESRRPRSEEQVPLHEEFIYCCGAATQVLKCGPWKNLLETESLPRLLFLIIPGNPGLAGYYRTFVRALYHGLNQQYPVWVVSHAGHCKPPNGMEMTEDTDIKELEDVFGLHGQIEHKLDFLRKNVPKDMKLVLIGHSIGCYITLEMMKRASELQVVRAINTILLCRVINLGDVDSITAGFAIMGFPSCRGTVDGTHIPIWAPNHQASEYINWKGYFSMVLQALVNHHGEFMDIYVKWSEKVHNACVFQNSSLFQKLHPTPFSLATPSELGTWTCQSVL